MQNPKKPKKLKPKELKFVETYVKIDFNGTQAVKQVYGIKDDKYASVKAVRLIGKDSVAQAIEVKTETLKSALINQGITPEKIALTIDKLLDADDYNANDKGLKHTKDIYGIEDLDQKPKQNNTYNFIFNEATQERIKKIDAEIKAQLINPNVKNP